MAFASDRRMNKMKINHLDLVDGTLAGTFTGAVTSGSTIATLETVQSQTFNIVVDDTYNDDSANYKIPAGSIVKAIKLTPSGFTGGDDSYNVVITNGTADEDDSVNAASWAADGTCDSRNVYLEITAFGRTKESWVKVTKGTATTAAATKIVKVEIIFATYFAS
jgi:hypothetical protein